MQKKKKTDSTESTTDLGGHPANAEPDAAPEERNIASEEYLHKHVFTSIAAYFNLTWASYMVEVLP